VTELAVVVEETAIAGVVEFVIKKLAVIFVRWGRRRLGFVSRGSRNHRCDGNEQQADKEQSYVFHRSRRLGYISDEPTAPDVSGRKYSGKAIIRESRESLGHATSRAHRDSHRPQVWCNPSLRFA